MTKDKLITMLHVSKTLAKRKKRLGKNPKTGKAFTWPELVEAGIEKKEDERIQEVKNKEFLSKIEAI